MKKNFKRFLTLSLCAVACMSVSAKATINGGVLTINGSNDVQFNNLNEVGGGQITKIKLVGDFRNGWSGYWLQNGTAQEKASITEIDMSQADMSGDNNVWSFVSFPNLKTVVWPTEGKITNIPSYAFKQTGIETLHIPGYIKFIRSQAIDDASNAKNLKKVYFDKLEGKDASVRMHIERQAFSNNYALRDVYILTEGVLTADNNAFPHWDTYGHADVSRTYARLYYPKSKIELYVNLKHVITENMVGNEKLFQEWLVEHYNQACRYQNGFYEFLNHGPIDVKPEPVGTSNLYTFSDTVSYIVPAGVKAYIVNSISPDVNDKRILHLSLRSVKVIPAYTGVILYGGTNAFDEKGNPYISMSVVNYDGEVFDRNNTNGNVNYLTGTANKSGVVTHIYPTQTYPGSDIVYYNYWMGRYSQTESGKIYKNNHGNYGNGAGLPENDWVSFFRIAKKGGTAPLGRAYLSLSSNEFSFAASGGAIVIDVDDQLDASNIAEFYRNEFKDEHMNLMNEDEMKAARLWYLSDGTKIEWAKDWGTVNINYNEIIATNAANAKPATVVEEDGIAGSIAAEKTTGDNNYYTLQGVKVDNPKKGVFIKNGKKIVLK